MIGDRAENAILKNILTETLRVYGAGEDPRGAGHLTAGWTGTQVENGVLRQLLDATTRAYEDRLNAFRAEKDLVRQVLSNTSDVVVTTDLSGAVTTLNPCAQALLGRSPAESRGRDLRELVHLVRDEGGPLFLDLESCLEEDRPIELRRCYLLGQDERRHPVEGRISPIHGLHQRVLGAVLLLRWR